jgi:hypothetical protein
MEQRNRHNEVSSRENCEHGISSSYEPNICNIINDRKEKEIYLFRDIS